MRLAHRSGGQRTLAAALVTAITCALALFLLGERPAAAVPPGGPVEIANGARVTITPLRVAPGGVVRVTGTNWKAKGSRVYRRPVVTVKLNDLHIVATFPIRNQRFTGLVRIPRQVKPGRYWLRFLAARPATSVKSRPFVVVRPQPQRRR